MRVPIERLERMWRRMAQQDIGALVCRLPENVVYLTGYWPVLGTCMALVPRNENPILVIAETEEEYVGDLDNVEISPYIFESLHCTRSLPEMFAAKLRELLPRVRGGLIGYEGSFGNIAANYWAGEAKPVDQSFVDVLNDVFSPDRIVDFSEAITQLRQIKDSAELEMLKIVNEIALEGLAAAKSALRPGIRDVDIAALIESTILTKGMSYKGVGRARGFAQVMAGVESAKAWKHFNLTIGTVLEEGDLASIELGTVADGYWSDLTRVFSVGPASMRQKSIHALVHKAQKKAMNGMAPGIDGRTIDQLARQVIADAGYGEFYPHQLGHGVGLTWHEPPFLHPEIELELQPGMVVSVEPGIYIPGWGGLRIEDNVCITESGSQNLSEGLYELD